MPSLNISMHQKWQEDHSCIARHSPPPPPLTPSQHANLCNPVKFGSDYPPGSPLPSLPSQHANLCNPVKFASDYPSGVSWFQSTSPALSHGLSELSALIESAVLVVMGVCTLPLMCVRRCLVKWSLRPKALAQTTHTCAFSLVWIRKCRCSSSERVKLFPHTRPSVFYTQK